MTYDKAVKVLSGYQVDDGGIYSLSPYVGFSYGKLTWGRESIRLDGDFTAEELTAFVVIMRHKPRPIQETRDMNERVIHIASVCHEANRAYCLTLGDASQLSWTKAPEWQRRSAVTGVELALKGSTPEKMHESWSAEKVGDGWVYGDVKDADAKTHPCLVPYAQLPETQRKKDDLFLAVVNALK